MKLDAFEKVWLTLMVLVVLAAMAPGVGLIVSVLRDL